MSEPHPYWTDPEHMKWQQHYAEYCGGYYLLFSPQFQTRCLPPDMRESNHAPDLLIQLLDTATGLHYTCRHVVAYEGPDRGMSTQAQDWNDVKAENLHGYFYSEHFCGCHIASAIEAAGQKILGYHDVELSEDDRCPRGRFKIESIIYEKMPDLVLMSETITEEELDDRIRALSGAPVRA